MPFHVLSEPILTHDIVESEVHPDISAHPRISVVPIPPHPPYLQTSNELLFLILAPLKVAFQVVSVWWILAYRTKPVKWLLVQVGHSRPAVLLPHRLTDHVAEPTLYSDFSGCVPHLLSSTD